MIKRTLCFTNPAYLSLKDGQMVVRLPEVEKSDMPESLKRDSIRTIPVEDIGVVVLDNRQITITHGLLEALLENNCAVVTCDARGMPVGLMLPLCGNTVQSERFRLQTDATLPLKKQLWQQTVRAKIANQAAVLRLLTDTDTGCMTRWIDDVRSGDADNLEGRDDILCQLHEGRTGAQIVPAEHLVGCFVGIGVLLVEVARASPQRKECCRKREFYAVLEFHG